MLKDGLSISKKHTPTLSVDAAGSGALSAEAQRAAGVGRPCQSVQGNNGKSTVSASETILSMSVFLEFIVVMSLI